MCTALRTASLVICRPHEQATAVPADTGELYSARGIARTAGWHLSTEGVAGWHLLTEGIAGWHLSIEGVAGGHLSTEGVAGSDVYKYDTSFTNMTFCHTLFTVAAL
jgi:hypothetical protein